MRFVNQRKAFEGERAKHLQTVANADWCYVALERRVSKAEKDVEALKQERDDLEERR